MREEAAASYSNRGLGPLPWEPELIARWMEFSDGEYYAGFIALDPYCG